VSRVDLIVPDIGNFVDILVVDVLVKKGDSVDVDTPLVTLETDKASMDVPATSAGTVIDVLLKAGDKVSKGTVIARVETNSQVDSAGGVSAEGAGSASAGSGGARGGGAAGASAAVDSGLTTGGPASNAGNAQDSDAEFSAAFDADELERTVTQPVLSLTAAQAAAASGNTGSHAALPKGAADAGSANSGATARSDAAG